MAKNGHRPANGAHDRAPSPTTQQTARPNADEQRLASPAHPRRTVQEKLLEQTDNPALRDLISDVIRW